MEKEKKKTKKKKKKKENKWLNSTERVDCCVVGGNRPSFHISIHSHSEV